MKYNLFTAIFLCVLFLGNVNAQLVADFTADNQEGCEFVEANFTNTSTNGGTPINCQNGFSYSWTFNPGVSVQCNPGNIFNNAGTYQVCLTVTNDATNESVTECKQDFITVHPLPDVSFTSTPEQGCVPLEVCFQNTTTVMDGTPVTCIWDFGDGSSVQDCSTEPVCHQYSQPNTYVVSLSVMDDNSCPITSFVDTIETYGIPEIDVTSDATSSCSPPLSVNFTNNTPGIEDNTFTWIFEGADTPTFEGGTPPTVTWSNAGVYDVTVIAEHFAGCFDTLVLDDYIAVGNQVFFTPNNYEVCTGSTISFSNESIGAAESWTWDFGDGSDVETVENPNHEYNIPGCYNVTLTADFGDCVSTYTDFTCINVINAPPVTLSNDNPEGCVIPHTVGFTVNGNSGTGTATWTFGDPELGASFDMNPNFTFNEFGVHPITLTYSEGGCELILVDTIRVQPIELGLSGGQVNGCAPLNVNITETSDSPFPFTDWEWIIPGVGTFSGPTLSTTITNAGEYDVILSVTNTQGCIVTDTFPEWIQVGVPPVLDFAVAPSQACADTAFSFTDMSDNTVDQWLWDFGDMGTSAQQNPVYSYTDTGVFEVCLTAFYNGCEAAICKPDIVTVLGPIANMRVPELNCDDPYTVIFVNTSVDADEVTWDFGDPAITTDVSSLDSVAYTYSNEGVYDVTLAAYNAENDCSDTVVQTITIVDVEAAFALPVTSGCAHFVVNPFSQSSDAVAWQWTSQNGQINNPTSQSPNVVYYNGGTFTNDIKLVVTDVNGCQDSIVTNEEIVVNEITPNFSITNPAGCRPLTTDLIDSSSSLYGNLVSWEWSDLQGNVVTSSTPQGTMDFSTSGLYTIQLTATDDLGCTDSIRFVDTVLVTNPRAQFDVDSVVCSLQELNIVNSSWGAGRTHIWDFGDGTTSTAPNPTHNYDNEGTYEICLIVTDINECTDTSCHTVIVENPVANFAASDSAALCPPLIVDFINLSQNIPSGNSLWDFGDGTGTSVLDAPTHVYTQPGIYDVTLVTTGFSGCMDTIVFENYISLDGPTGSVVTDINTGCLPVEVTFYTFSDDPTEHSLSFGDGTLVEGNVVTTQDTFVHTYTTIGAFPPVLILHDTFTGCNVNIDLEDPVVLQDISVDFVATDTVICSSGITDFIGQVTPPDDPAISVEWILEGQTGPNPTTMDVTGVAYDTEGTYDVTFIATTGQCADTLVKTDYIIVEPVPNAIFTMSDSVGCAGLLNIDFNDASTISSNGSITAWLWDFGDGDTSNLSNPSHNYEVAGTYTVAFTVFSANGCTDQAFRTVLVEPNPELQISPVSELCIGDSAQLFPQAIGNPGTLTYSWTPTTDLSCTDCLNPFASPSVTTTYTLTVGSTAGCAGTAEVTVPVSPFPIPNINLDPDTAICIGTTVQLLAQGGTIDPASYQWDTASDSLSCYACPNPFASPITDTEYTVTVTGLGGCTATDSINISIFDPAADFLGEDVTICEGNSITLSDGGFGEDPAWTPAFGLSCTFCPNPEASPTETTTYTVTVEAPGSGCLISDEITVEVIPAASVEAGFDLTVCNGDTFQLSGAGIGELQWTPAELVSDSTIPNPRAAISETTTFYLYATTSSCTLVDSVTITGIDSIQVATEGENICAGGVVTLQATGGFDEYLWTPSEGLSDPTAANPTVEVHETTTFTVRGILGTCPSNVAEATVTINPDPAPSIIPVYNYYSGNPIELQVELPDDGNYGIQWIPADGLSCSDCLAPTALPDTNTTYVVLVTDFTTGCEGTVTTELRRIDVCDPEISIFVPNGFTPNGDGNNDVLYVRSTPLNQIRAFRVFDRWGGLVFETNSKLDGWDGTNGGKSLTPGVYVYYVEAICPVDGSTILKKGNVTLIR